MPNDINNWGAFLTQVNLETQQCTFPFANPFMANPTQTYQPNGHVTYLLAEQWVTHACACYIAKTLGATVTPTPPEGVEPLVNGWVNDQPVYYIKLSTGYVFRASDLVDMFLHTGSLQVLKSVFPGFLAGTN